MVHAYHRCSLFKNLARSRPARSPRPGGADDRRGPQGQPGSAASARLNGRVRVAAPLSAGDAGPGPQRAGRAVAPSVPAAGLRRGPDGVHPGQPDALPGSATLGIPACPAGRRALVTVLPAARGRGRRRGEWRHHHGPPGGRAARAAVPAQGRSEARQFRRRPGVGVHHARRRDPGQGAGGVRRQPGDEGIAGFRPAAAVDAQLPDTPAGKPRIKL